MERNMCTLYVKITIWKTRSKASDKAILQNICLWSNFYYYCEKCTVYLPYSVLVRRHVRSYVFYVRVLFYTSEKSHMPMVLHYTLVSHMQKTFFWHLKIMLFTSKSVINKYIFLHCILKNPFYLFLLRT